MVKLDQAYCTSSHPIWQRIENASCRLKSHDKATVMKRLINMQSITEPSISDNNMWWLILWKYNLTSYLLNQPCPFENWSHNYPYIKTIPTTQSLSKMVLVQWLNCMYPIISCSSKCYIGYVSCRNTKVSVIMHEFSSWKISCKQTCFLGYATFMLIW